jgi:hypothetical protein
LLSGTMDLSVFFLKLFNPLLGVFCLFYWTFWSLWDSLVGFHCNLRWISYASKYYYTHAYKSINILLALNRSPTIFLFFVWFQFSTICISSL